MPTPTYVRGVGGKVTAGTVEFAVTDWNFTKTNRLVDITHSGSGGYSEHFPSITDGSGTFNAIYDKDNQPDNGYTANTTGGQDSGPDSAGALEPGKKVSLNLFLGDSGKSYSFQARIESLAVTSAVGDVVKFSCNFKSTGQITDPT